MLLLAADMLDRSYRLAIRHKVWLEAGHRFVLGDGGVALLQAIDATGSLRGAANDVGWSYRHALAYVNNAERALGYRLVDRVRGGNDRGGARLTPRGRDFVSRYAVFRQRLARAVDRLSRSALAR